MTSKLLAWVLGAAFVLAGANHFLHTDFYVSIMPGYLPWHRALVYLSGVAEILIGAMLFSPRLRRFGAWSAIALMIAVFPANLQMALHTELYPQFSALALWLRLPFQGVLIAWAWWLTRPDDVRRSDEV